MTSSDQPLEDPLASIHRSLADRLSYLIALNSSDRSMVIGIFGPWGSGKSSFVRTVLSSLVHTGFPENHLFTFNAWTHQRTDYSRFFILGLADAIGVVVSDAVVVRLRHYADLLGGAATISEKGLASMTRVLQIASLAGVGSLAFLDNRVWQVTILVASLVLYAAGPVLSASSRGLKIMAVIWSKLGRSFDDPEVVRATIGAEIIKLENPVLAVFEDIDRIAPSAILGVTALMKREALFPNLIYLVLADPATLRHTLALAVGEDNVEMELNRMFDTVLELPVSAP